MDKIDSRLNFECLDPDVRSVVACLQKLKWLKENVAKCYGSCSSGAEKEMLFCLLRRELANIQDLLNEASRPLSCATDSILACGAGIDGVNRAIRTDVNNVLATLPSAGAQSQIGRMFAASVQYNLTELSGRFGMVVRNPTPGRIMYLDSIFGGHALAGPDQSLSYRSSIDITILRDSPPLGNTVVPENLNFGSSVASAMVVTATTELLPGFQVAQTMHTFGHFMLDFSGKIIVPPLRSVGIRLFLREILGADEVVGGLLTVTWYELDES